MVDDVLCREAALTVVAVLRTLSAMMPTGATFSAVVTHGNAVSALIGAALLTYRLFGPVVRESNALLAAAPRAPTCVAFASDGFRQQHCNFAVRRQRDGPDPSMSHAVPHETEGQVALATSSESGAAAIFGPQSTWRVRGAGALAVGQLFFLALNDGVSK
jgi:hypothetical protein